MGDLGFLEILTLIIALLGGGGALATGWQVRRISPSDVDKSVYKAERENEIDRLREDLKDDIARLRRDVDQIYIKLNNGLQVRINELAERIAGLEGREAGGREKKTND